MTLQVQFVTLGMMLLGGLALGGLYDVYRVLAGQLRAPRYAYYLLDLVFWFIGTLLIFTLLYRSNLGQVRMFVFVGLAMGIILYFLLFSRTMIRVIVWMIHAVRTLIRIGRKVIDVFVVTPVVWLYRAVIIFLGFLAAIAVFLFKVMIQLLYPVWKLLLWLLQPMGRWIRVPFWINKTIQGISTFIRRFFDRA